MDTYGKLRPLYLLQILKNHTDEYHSLTTAQLCKMLKDEYGIETFRTTIKSDIEVLQKAGVSIQVTRSTQNLYNYIERDFDIPEVKLLMDAVLSSKFITKEKSNQLIAKLSELAGPYKSKELKRNLVVDGRIKPENEQVFLIADSINEAINQKKKSDSRRWNITLKKSESCIMMERRMFSVHTLLCGMVIIIMP